MRNLVIVHLESLNLINYRMNRNKFLTLRRIESKSLSFNKFFSTATSTLMVIGDLLYGGMEQYEQCKSLDYIPQEYSYSSSLFDDLKEKGYRTNLYIYPDGGDRESAECRHIAGFHNEMVLIKDYGTYLKALEEAIHENEPFALMVCNYISNLSINNRASGYRYVIGTRRWENGYCLMDNCVEDLWRLLEKKNLLSNTTILFYGDHGDEYWQHSLHGGLAHAIEPYARLIWTPMWIYDERLNAGETEKLVSTIDIRKMMEQLLEADVEKVNIEDWLHRKYTIARGAYAAQPVRESTFNKGYSLTDGKYLMLVSTSGLELYDIEMDPECQNNFLDFFTLEEDDLTYKYDLHTKLSFHYRDFVDEKVVHLIRQKFYFFREKLRLEVERLYAAGGMENAIGEINFNQLHVIHRFL